LFNCGAKLTENQKECPLCHSTNKKFFVEVGNELFLRRKNWKLKKVDYEGFTKVVATSRTKKGMQKLQ
jgi:hypothetical protein